MTVGDFIGYLGAVFVVSTYSMRTMVPLRISAIISNLLLIAYGYFGAAYPTLVLHLILLPLNVYRLREMLVLIAEVRRAATGDLSMDWLKPFMNTRRFAANDILFRKGDEADEMFFLVSGKLRIKELGIEIAPGTLVGELGLVSPGRKRTQTLEATEESVVQRISYERLEQLYFQNPKFGVYFLRLTAGRLFENLQRAESELLETRVALSAARS